MAEQQRAESRRVTEEGEWIVPEAEPMAIEDIRDALVIREGSTFLLTDPVGNMPAKNTKGFGVYHADTRHLSTYTFNLNGAEPVTLYRGDRIAQIVFAPVARARLEPAPELPSTERSGGGFGSTGQK